MRFVLTILILLLAAPSLAADRVALLIGNARYQIETLALRNPVNDVRALSVRFQDLGFQVRSVEDANLAEMQDALAWFEAAAKDAEVATIFFAGHGVQVAGENYLIGADLAALTPTAMREASVTLQDIRETLTRAAPRLGMVILDACRDNPLSADGQVEPGLATARGGAGTLIAYATDPGNVAYDGAGENSVFTSALLNTLATPGLDVRIMFGRVRQSVIRQTGGRQIPWVEESVLGEHYLAGAPERGTEIAADEIALWRRASVGTDMRPLLTYIDRYPEGIFIDFARARLTEIERVETARLEAAGPAEAVLAAVDPLAIGAALDIMGYATLVRGIVPAQPELAAAFNAWRGAQPNPEAATPEFLLRDAARLTMFLAASTAERIRNDLRALSGIEKTRALAETDLAEVRRLALGSPEAAALLPAFEADVAAIRDAEERVARRLDESREYYHRLVLLAEERFREQTELALLSQAPQTRGGLADLQQRLYRDARVFVEQVSTLAGRPRGSYAWLTDFLEQG